MVCHGGRPDRSKNAQTLRRSGTIVQESDGSLVAMQPDDAVKFLEEMDPEQKASYEW